MRHRLLLALALFGLAVLTSTCGRRGALSPTQPDGRVRPGYTRGAVAIPALATPANGAALLEPVALSWLPVSDPSGILGYNWQVSTTATFASIVLQNSTNGATQDTLSGLANGTYFWRVQAVSGAFVQGPFSAPLSFTVTGVAPGTLAPPGLGPTQAYSTFHPREVIRFHWSAVAGAITYRLEVSNDPTFPAGPLNPALFSFNTDNIPDPNYAFMLGDNQGTFFARVFAVNANSPQVGQRSLPSNTIQYTVSFTNPIGPAPVPISPTGGVSLTLPFALTWHHVPNPQPSGYEVQISPDATFAVNEAPLGAQLTDSLFNILTLTAGTKFWRVRSAQGMASPTTLAETAWSPAQSFVLSSAPPAPVSVTPAKAPLFSGENTFVQVQLSAGVPAAGATLALASSNPAVIAVPASIAVPGSAGLVQFQVSAGQVVAPTPVTITATLNGVSTGGTFNVLPPSLQAVVVPSSASGGALGGGNIMLNGQAPSTGAVVSLTSSSPAASPPATVTVPAGSFSAPFTMPTSDVAVNTPVTLTATWNGTSVQSAFTLTPRQAPTSISLTPTSVTGLGGSSFGRVTVATPPATDLALTLSANPPGIVTINNAMIIPAGSIQGGFNVFTNPVPAPTVVNITVTGGGVSLSAPLTVTPVSAPPPPTPGTPTQIAPADGANVSQPVTLDWSDVANAASYELQVSTSSAVTAPFAANPIVNVSQATVTGLPAQRLFWRVRAQNSAGAFGSFSAIERFTPSAAPVVASLNTLAVSPASVVGGVSTQGSVSLTSAAPAGGAVVALSSANTALAVVPASVTIAAGATSATFSVATTAVATASSAVLSASFAGVTRTATLALTPVPPPASLSAVSLNPASVTGGASSAGTLTLTSAAAAGGPVATLASSLPGVVTVPPSVTFAAGTSSVGFTAMTAAVTSATSVTITATLAGVVRTTTLTVNPASATPLPAPTQLAPVADLRVAPGVLITFDWSDVAGASGYSVQVANDSNFTGTLLVDQSLAVSQFATSALPVSTMWWRARATAGIPGAWSAARRFEVK